MSWVYDIDNRWVVCGYFVFAVVCGFIAWLHEERNGMPADEGTFLAGAFFAPIVGITALCWLLFVGIRLAVQRPPAKDDAADYGDPDRPAGG